MADQHAKITYGIIIIVCLILIEGVFRFNFGNMAIINIFDFRPGDGRCIGLKNGSEVLYTGHWLRTKPVKQEVNIFGYRGKIISKKRQNNSKRIILVGDSFTYGVGVKNDETFSEKIEKYINIEFKNKIKVINFGVPGLNMKDSYSQYSNFAINWSHDIVIYIMFSNDLFNSFCEEFFEDFLKKNLLSKILINLYIIRIPYLFYTFNNMDNYDSLQNKKISGKIIHERGIILDDNLDKFKISSKKVDAIFGVVILGDPFLGLSDPEITDWIKKRGVPVLDVSELLRMEGFVLPRDRHLSVAGNRALARRVVQWIYDEEVFAKKLGLGQRNLFVPRTGSSRGPTPPP